MPADLAVPSAPPADALAAATHPDPYPFYAALRQRGPLAFDPALGLWIASDAATVTAVLWHPAARVRPAAEPVPRALLDTAAGEVFGRLVRMNDGPGHCPWKQAVAAALAGLDPRALERAAASTAQRLLRRGEGVHRAPGAAANELAFTLPVQALAEVLGLPGEVIPSLPADIDALACAFAAGASSSDVARGARAADRLLRAVGDALHDPDPHRGGTLVELARIARAQGLEDGASLAANGVGLLTQTYEATAGLIGNTLRALARETAWRERIDEHPEHLTAFVREVARHDAPVQNTRRFLAADATLARQELRAGDAVLVLLAAANRDAAANAEPDAFDPQRQAPRCFTFGAGAHACPGETVAVTLASAAVAAFLGAGCDPSSIAGGIAHRPSLNTRVPVFEAGSGTIPSAPAGVEGRTA